MVVLCSLVKRSTNKSLCFFTVLSRTSASTTTKVIKQAGFIVIHLEVSSQFSLYNWFQSYNDFIHG